jgi:hypothetical protein
MTAAHADKEQLLSWAFKQARAAADAADEIRAHKPRDCFHCTWHDRHDGTCGFHDQKPPLDFMSKDGACNDFIEEIPF